MALRELTDHEAIAAALANAVSSDPVRNTMFGTLARQLEDTAWAAVDAPRLAIRTSASFPVVLGGDWSSAQRADLVAVLTGLPSLRGLNGSPELVVSLVPLLPDRQVVRRMDERLFRLDELVPPAGVPGMARVAVDADRELLERWIAAFIVEAGALSRDPAPFVERVVLDGTAWLWLVDGEAVSVACRHLATAGSARVGPVYTPPERRGHGYGSAATAAASASILGEGGIPVLFTDLANPTSNKIYAQLGYRPVEDRVVVTFA